MFKGIDLTLKDAPIFEPLLVMESEIPEVPRYDSYFPAIPAKKWPSKFIVIERTQQSGRVRGSFVHATTWDKDTNEFGHIQTDLLDTTRLRKLTGKVGEKFLTKYRELMAKDFGSRIHATSMHIGTDPEMFVMADGKLLPAFEFLPDKGHPFKPADIAKRSISSLYWDGFQAEFNTNPSACLEWQTEHTHQGLKLILQHARAKHKDAKLAATTVVEIPDGMLESASAEQLALGCKPSLNAYGITGVGVTDGRELKYRFTGGHQHFGIGQRDPLVMTEIVKSLDCFLALPCVSLFANFDNPVRRQYYGLPGEYRLPKHGLEYRTLSNAWAFHPGIMHLVWDYARRVVSVGLAKMRFAWDGNEAETIEVVQNCDVPAARKVMKRNEKLIKAILAKAIPTHYEIAYDTFMNGMEYIVKDPSDIEGNWHLFDRRWVQLSRGAGQNWSTLASSWRTANKAV